MGEIFDAPNVIQPDWQLGPYILGEPVVGLTNFLIAGTCLYVLQRMRPYSKDLNAYRSFRCFLIALAFASFWGGLVGHILLHYLSFKWKIPGWCASMFAAYFLSSTAIIMVAPAHGEKWRNFLKAANTFFLPAGLIAVLSTSLFRVVQLQMALSILLLAVPTLLGQVIRNGDPGARYFLGGIGLVVAASVVHVLEWSLGIWFTYADIGHVLVCGAVLLYWKGWALGTSNFQVLQAG